MEGDESDGDKDRNPIGADADLLRLWTAERAAIAARADIYYRLEELLGKTIKGGTHHSLGGSVSLAGAVIDGTTLTEKGCEAVYVILSKKAADGESRVVSLTLADLIRAGAVEPRTEKVGE